MVYIFPRVCKVFFDYCIYLCIIFIYMHRNKSFPPPLPEPSRAGGKEVSLSCPKPGAHAPDVAPSPCQVSVLVIPTTNLDNSLILLFIEFVQFQLHTFSPCYDRDFSTFTLSLLFYGFLYIVLLSSIILQLLSVLNNIP